jgi:hypothetical protein
MRLRHLAKTFAAPAPKQLIKGQNFLNVHKVKQVSKGGFICLNTALLCLTKFKRYTDAPKCAAPALVPQLTITIILSDRNGLE